MTTLGMVMTMLFSSIVGVVLGIYVSWVWYRVTDREWDNE